MEEDFVETDEDYEFDAAQFYDFTRPENDSEIQEVERWFEVSGDYPHSRELISIWNAIRSRFFIFFLFGNFNKCAISVKLN